MKFKLKVHLLTMLLAETCQAFSPMFAKSQTSASLLPGKVSRQDDDGIIVENVQSRKSFIQNILTGTAMVTGLSSLNALLLPEEASALVEGYAPPPKNKSKALPEEYRQGTAALADSDDNGVVPPEAYIKLPSGVTYADLRIGNGEEAAVGKKVNMQWVLRRSNGYYVEASKDNDSVPFIFKVGDSKAAIAGLNEGIQGMKVGGVRRLLIPPSLAYVEGLEDDKPGPVPAGFGPKQQMRRVMNFRKDVPGEYIFLEVQLTRVR